MAITHSLEGGPSLQDNLGMGHVVALKVTGSAGTDAVCTGNDRSAVLTRTGPGDFTVTFGDAFLAAPMAVVTPVAAASTTQYFTGQIISSATNAVRVMVTQSTINATVSVATDTDFHLFVFGKRYV